MKKSNVIDPLRLTGTERTCLVCGAPHPTNQCHCLGGAFVPKQFRNQAARVLAANPNLKPNDEYVNRKFPPRRARLPRQSNNTEVTVGSSQDRDTSDDDLAEADVNTTTVDPFQPSCHVGELLPEAMVSELEQYIQENPTEDILEQFTEKLNM